MAREQKGRDHFRRFFYREGFAIFPETFRRGEIIFAEFSQRRKDFAKISQKWADFAEFSLKWTYVAGEGAFRRIFAEKRTDFAIFPHTFRRGGIIFPEFSQK